jgi:hypothetical protein
MAGGREWCVSRGEERFGPFSWDEVVALAREGRVVADDLVWREGDVSSRRAGSVPGLVPRAERRLDRRAQFALAGVAALLVAAIAVTVVVSAGRDDRSGLVTGSVPSSAESATVGSAGSTAPVDVGVAEVTAPDPAALIVDGSGAIVSGDQLLVMVRDGAGREVADAVAVAVGGEVVGQVDLADMWQVRIPATGWAGLQAAIAAAGPVEGVEFLFENATSSTAEEIWGTPISALNDPVYTGAAGDGYRMIGVDTAWTYLKGSGLPSNPVHVGVTDTGVWKGTGEFEGKVTINQPDPANGVDADPEDIEDGAGVVVGADPGGGHGTGVTSIIGADADNGGTTGIATAIPNLTVSTTDIYSPPYGTRFAAVPTDVKDDAQVTYPDGVSFTSGAFKAIAGQIKAGARVINMSWGCPQPPCAPGTVAAYKMFFEKMAARHPKVLFVAAAGNEAQAVEGGYYPAGLALPNMITVGNVVNDGTTASSSNTTGPDGKFVVDLAAPGDQAVQGVDANGTIIDDTYQYPGGQSFGGGTSMAAPQVTAAAALLLSVSPDLTAQQIKDLLVSSARTSITRPDGTEQAIDAGVGGRVLAIDLAVLTLINQRRAELGLTPATLTADDLIARGTVDAVAVSGEPDEWTVRGIVKGCEPACTDVSIELQGEGAIGGTTTQHITTAPGEISWSATIPTRPATIVIRRSDNNAGSRILIPAVPSDDLTGSWIGQGTVTAVDSPGRIFNGMYPNRTFEISMEAPASNDSASRTVTIVFDIPEQFDPNFFPDGPPSVPYLTQVADEIVSMTDQVNGIGTLTGTLQRAPDGTATGLTGTWQWYFDETERADATISGTFTLTRCPADGCPPA